MNVQLESAVRGYHYYRKYWSPKEHETLNCYHEPRNPFDIFTIKTCSHGSLQPVGHLLSEINRLIKFILNRGAEVGAKLTSNQYRCSPITQGGLEIPCAVNIKMPANILNRNLLKRYEEIVSHLYVEPEEGGLREFNFANEEEKHFSREFNFVDEGPIREIREIFFPGKFLTIKYQKMSTI